MSGETEIAYYHIWDMHQALSSHGMTHLLSFLISAVQMHWSLPFSQNLDTNRYPMQSQPNFDSWHIQFYYTFSRKEVWLINVKLSVFQGLWIKLIN
jgi:hypothetical protein